MTKKKKARDFLAGGSKESPTDSKAKNPFVEAENKIKMYLEDKITNWLEDNRLYLFQHTYFFKHGLHKKATRSKIRKMIKDLNLVERANITNQKPSVSKIWVRKTFA